MDFFLNQFSLTNFLHQDALQPWFKMGYINGDSKITELLQFFFQSFGTKVLVNLGEFTHKTWKGDLRKNRFEAFCFMDNIPYLLSSAGIASKKQGP